MQNLWEDEDQFGPEERQLLEWRHENQSILKAAQFGVDMHSFAHEHPDGVKIVEHAMVMVQESALTLLNEPLDSKEAKQAQVEGRAGMRIIEFIRGTIESGAAAIREMEDSQ